MSTITVNNTASFLQAIQFAKAGDTILLGPGTYTPITLRDANFTAPVTIASADPSQPAVLTGLTVSSSSGLVFSGLSFSTAAATGNFPFSVNGSANISLTNVNVYGNDTQEFAATITGLLIRGCQNVSVTGSRFHKLMIGICQVNNVGLLISNNIFHDLHCRGIDGGGSNNVVISYNTIHDIFPTPGGLHSDGIQFWTNASNPAGANIQIIGNNIYRGDGLMFQGIFVRADPTGAHPFTNMTIQGNNLTGLDYNGIAVGGVSGLTVSQNVVASYSDRTSELVVDSCTNVSVTSNRASLFKFWSLLGFTQSGNLGLAAVTNLNTDAAPTLTQNNATAPIVHAFAITMSGLGSTATATTTAAAPIAASVRAHLALPTLATGHPLA
ncbi:MAG TPA: right-handed parallel beta-helix repeat-containing protein [Caulobacteraceae bacterium]|nr:right-handed parallel beta-helix repeat-containing protein [Caulobacteraceae bacterium]